MDTNFDDDDDIEISGRPLMIGDFVELDRYVTEAYKYMLTCPRDVRRFLEPVIDAACDFACEMAYDLDLDPNEVDTSRYVHRVWTRDSKM